MSDPRLPIVLVAEKSVLGTFDLVLRSLERYVPEGDVYVVVPDDQVVEFAPYQSLHVSVVRESNVLPEWDLERVGERLGHYKARAGWYYQQFLKLSFGDLVKCDFYVIWDADTVMLQELSFVIDGRMQMNSSIRSHKPYFDTYRRLFMHSPPVAKSLISQFMIIDQKILTEMQEEIKINSGQQCWIDAVLQGLPLKSASEFSEYETYGNYVASRYPDKFELTKINWFLYGSEVLPTVKNKDLNFVINFFRGFSCVAFERHHKKSLLKTITAYILFYLKIGR